MKNYLIISMLGVLGVLSRHFLENRLGQKSDFIPMGTFCANMIGCLAAGFIYQFIGSKTNHQEIAAMALIGFCGGLTTFSSYILSSLNDLNNGDFGRAAVYLIGSPLLGLVSTFIGMRLYKLFI